MYYDHLQLSQKIKCIMTIYKWDESKTVSSLNWIPRHMKGCREETSVRAENQITIP